MKERTVTAIIGVLLFLPVIYFGGWFFVLVILSLGLLGLHELARMKGLSLVSGPGFLASLLLAGILLPRELWLGTFLEIDGFYWLYGLIILLLSATVFLADTFKFEDFAVLVAGALYIGGGFHFFIQVRQTGLTALIYLLLAVWATDIGAYTLGSLFGRHPLAPTVSPNKSIEGSLGGIATALVTTLIWVHFYPPVPASKLAYFFLAILLSVSGQLGDLVESALKRYYETKDSGQLLPGHGGVLDRFDSLLLASYIFSLWLSLH